MQLQFISIAAAFIAAISACASLIISANTKHERIARLLRAACTSWREAKTVERQRLIEQQIDLFRKRYGIIQEVQRKLFRAIRSFVVAFYFFVVLGMSITAKGYWEAFTVIMRIADLSLFVTGIVIACLFFRGLTLMMSASGDQLDELGMSHETLDLERSDIPSSEAPGKVPALTAGRFILPR